MLRKILFALTVLLVVCFAISPAVQAQPPMPPLPTQPASRSPQAKAASPAPASLTLGQPGLSYRYDRTFGVTDQAYPADTTHLNRPSGLFIDGAGNLFVTEQQGKRLLKFNSSGAFQFSIGTAGLGITGDYTFTSPNDLVTDSSGNIWLIDEPRVMEFDATGQLIQQFPSTEPWLGGDANDRFNGPQGIALDEASKLLFVSDTWNHRVQVYDISGGSPVYSATIGLTGTPGGGTNQFDAPSRIALDANHNLYVVDRNNNRVQKCSLTTAWNCVTLVSMVAGLNLNNPQGITVDQVHDQIYIADTNNARTLECTPAGACSVFEMGGYWPYDIALDTAGNLYALDGWADVVVRYNASGIDQGVYLGVDQVPYLTDQSQFNHPRVAIDPNDNILVLEENGQRLTKLNLQGVAQWSVGHPGQNYPDNNNSFNWPAGVAADKNGNIYVADSFRIQIFSPAGAYLDTIPGSGASSNVPFNHLNGIAVDPASGAIYVSDNNDHVVYVFNSSRQYVGMLGVKGMPGPGNNQFDQPAGLAVDKGGNLYVADQQNCRVQKFNSSRVYQFTFGSGGCGNSFAELSGPQGVAVDVHGKVFVADDWNNRVEVFDSAGAYLTTLAGSWGALSSQFRDAPTVAVDSKGSVYVGDAATHRIQKFALGVNGWRQTNLNGFGDRYRGIATLNEFNGKLYAGVTSWGNPIQIWQTSTGSNWMDITPYGSTINTVPAAVLTMTNFNGQMYAGTGWANDPNYDTIWRTANGTTWTPVVTDDFGSSGTSRNVDVLAVFQNQIYAAVSSESPTTGVGVSIFRSPTGNPGSWSPVVTGGNGDIHNTLIDTLVEFNGALYASGKNSAQGAFIWKSTDGLAWNQVGVYGLDASHQEEAISMAVFKGQLFLGTYHNGNGEAGQLWSSPDGDTWSPLSADGFGDTHNEAIMGLHTFDGALYAVTDNGVTGSQVWKSSDGLAWKKVAPDGMGNSNNNWTLRSFGIATFNNSLFVALANDASGVEVWQLQHMTFLPIVTR